MSKKLVFFICLLIAGFSLRAADVPQSVAAATGLNFWNSHARQMKVPGCGQSSIIKTYTLTDQQQPLYYVFDIAPAGFIIVAAEDAINPILGYSFEGSYQAENQAPAFSDWMQRYVQVIQKCRNENRQQTEAVASVWTKYAQPVADDAKGETKSVAPLCTTRWDQGANYNYYCPAHASGPAGHCVTGCVATAMAQIMKYWNYPAQGMGSHSYEHPFYGTLAVDFSQSVYDWTDMTNYANSASKFAISELIYNCGVSVDMNYSPVSSGSFTPMAVDALKNYFHYRSTAQTLERSQYTAYDWRKIIMENLDDGKPILYSGSGGEGGHAWVCDGYQDTTHFNMNWGWGGSNNGYFDLENISEFPDGQDIVVGIIPYDGYYCTGTKVYTDKTRSFGDGSSYSYYWNNTDCDWLIQPAGASEITLSFTQFSTELNKDVVSVYDGSTTSAPLLGTWSGTTVPPTLTSTGGSMLVTFASDATNQGLGWEATYTATVVGTEENESAASFSIFPNPAQSTLNLSLSAAIQEKLVLEITNLTGQLVLTEDIPATATKQLIDISELSKGIYAVSLTGMNHRFCTRLVIE